MFSLQTNNSRQCGPARDLPPGGMVLEGVLTTVDLGGSPNVAAMGAITNSDCEELVLRPFISCASYQNLKAHPEGVFHVTDDVELIVRAALDLFPPFPPLEPSSFLRGFAIPTSCRFHEFRVVEQTIEGERARMMCRVVHTRRNRDFFGFHRARHAVLEVAILATRLHLLSRADVAEQVTRFSPLIQKTAGPNELAAWRLLLEYIDNYPE